MTDTAGGFSQLFIYPVVFIPFPSNFAQNLYLQIHYFSVIKLIESSITAAQCASCMYVNKCKTLISFWFDTIFY